MLLVCLFAITVLLTVIYWSVKPSWKQAGPFLVDTYLIGIALYAFGAVGVMWTIPQLVHAEIVATMGFVALVSGLGGAIAFSLLFGPAYRGMDYVRFHAANRKISKEEPAIRAFVLFSCLACAFFTYSLFSSQLFSQLLTFENITKNASLSTARNVMTAGTAGYMFPGYVKQFRDILLPMALFSMAVLYDRPTRSVLFWAGIAMAVVAMLLSGQRGSILLLFVCLGASRYYANRMIHGSGYKPNIGRYVILVGILLTVWIGLSIALGRIDTDSKTSSGNAVVDSFGGVADRLAMALPRENAASFQIWGYAGRDDGLSWQAELGSIFGTQNDPMKRNYLKLSNYMMKETGGSTLGNSPLGLPADVWLNWGWRGLYIVPLMYALLFGFLDMLLLSERSTVFFGIKVFLAVALPSCISPYTFILYGGAVTLALVAGIKVFNRFKSLLSLPARERLDQQEMS